MERERLEHIVREMHWMARRYADGRRSYCPGMFNDMTRELIAAGLLRAPLADGTVWARDGDGNRGMDRLTDEEAALGDDWWNKRLRNIMGDHPVRSFASTFSAITVVREMFRLPRKQ